MHKYTVVMNGWAENEVYHVTARNEAEAIAKAYKLAEAPWASLVEIECES